MNSYYTYILLDPSTGTPFYIGKGKDRRMYQHWMHRNSAKCVNYLVCKKLKELEISKLKPMYEKVLINATESQALDKERELIALYGRIDNQTGILCNLTDGGESGASSWSQHTRNRKSTTELSKNKGKPVSQYSLDGTLIETFPSAKRASEKVQLANRSYITQCCKRKRVSAGGFLWSYVGDDIPTYSKKYYRKVYQYDLEGNFISVYISLTEAQQNTSVELHNISECCRGNSKTAGGYIWQYAS